MHLEEKRIDEEDCRRACPYRSPCPYAPDYDFHILSPVDRARLAVALSDFLFLARAHISPIILYPSLSAMVYSNAAPLE